MPLWLHFMFWLILQKITPPSGAAAVLNVCPPHSNLFQFTFREEEKERKILHNFYCIKSLRRTQSVACSNNSSRFDWFLTLSVQQFWSFVPFHSASSCEMRFCWFDLNIVCFCFQRNIYFSRFSVFILGNYHDQQHRSTSIQHLYARWRFCLVFLFLSSLFVACHSAIIFLQLYLKHLVAYIWLVGWLFHINYVDCICFRYEWILHSDWNAWLHHDDASVHPSSASHSFCYIIKS